MKKCTFCSEEIQAEAIYCGYCKRDLKSIPIIDKHTNQGETGVHQVEHQPIEGLEKTEKQHYLNQKVNEDFSRAEKVLIFFFVIYGLITIYELYNGTLLPDRSINASTFAGILLSMITLAVIAVVEFIWKKIKSILQQDKNLNVIDHEMRLISDLEKTDRTRISVMYLRAYKFFRWILVFFILVIGFYV